MRLKKKNPPANAGDAGDTGLIPWWGRSPGEGNGNSLQNSFLGNARDRGVWWATIHGVTKSRTQLSVHTHTDIRLSARSQIQETALEDSLY